MEDYFANRGSRFVIGFEGYLCRENVAIWGVGDLTNWARAKAGLSLSSATRFWVGRLRRTVDSFGFPAIAPEAPWFPSLDP